MTTRHSAVYLVLAVLCISLVSGFAPTAHAQIAYSVSQEWLKAWLNPDASVDLLYNISFIYTSGSPQGLFDLGMPNANFQIHYVQDLSGSALQYQDISAGSYAGIEITLKHPITLNQNITFIVSATVQSLIYPDSTNAGNYGLQLYTAIFQSATGTEDLRLEIELPPGVPQDTVKSPSGLQFDNVFTDENRTAVFWERTNWFPGDSFMAGVSFPQQYLEITPFPTSNISTETFPPYPTPNEGGGIPSNLAFVGVFFIFIVVIIIITAIRSIAKSVYESPSLSVEAIGANRSLSAVEAGLVLGLKPVRVITMMLYGLLLKKQVAVIESQPLLKLQRIETPTPPATAPAANGTSNSTSIILRYYEIDFLKAIKPDGTLDEEALAQDYRGLVSTVNQKLKGYSREDTENYYRSIVATAWNQVTKAGTADLMGEALDKNLEWLLADDKFDDTMKTTFTHGIVIVPSPLWWWYWGGPQYPTEQSPSTAPTSSISSKPTMSTGPTTRPYSPTTQPPVKPAPMAGQDFANNIVKGVQGASNNIVRNVQDFANKLAPFPPPPNRGENSVSGHPSCVCACHACACACACVGCACACAGGGAR